METDANIQTLLLGGTISLFVTLLTAYPMARIAVDLEAKRNRRAEFRSRLQTLLALAVERPQLEHSAFCDGWSDRNKSDEAYWMYDVYCCMVFNLIEDVWKHAEGNRATVEEIVSYEEWCVCHREWWKDNMGPNCMGYDDGFYNFVQTVINAHEASRKEMAA